MRSDGNYVNQEQFAQLGGASRRKTWDELEVGEQVKLLRDVIRSKELAINELRESIALLMQHQHGRNGELLRPVFFGMGGVQGPGYDPLA